MFDGKEKNFAAWWARFMSYATCHGFANVLKTNAPAELKGIKQADAETSQVADIQ